MLPIEMLEHIVINSDIYLIFILIYLFNTMENMIYQPAAQTG